MTTETRTTITPPGFQERCHPACIACGTQTGEGLGLRFTEEPDGSVVAHFGCEAKYQGYPTQLHGGVIAMLVDAAMMHCLFVRRIPAVTARLIMKFRHPVEVGRGALVRARVVRDSSPRFILTAEIVQDDTVRATAEGLFFGQGLSVNSEGQA